ncbi:MAG TPA: hypothetical protein DCM50_00090, partial [Stenotrophomonas sp.]|nr:hypothetical protein [Stenotrophomonas sp.]
SGTLDGRTPPANADALRPGFGHSTALLVRGASHDNEMWLGNSAIAATITTFLAGGVVHDAELTLAPPVFVTSNEALLASFPR